MSEDIKKGLVGVVADESSVSKVVQETNSLTYRGYAVQDLCEHCSFEEVAYLLWHGELPKANQLNEFCEQEKAHRPLSASMLNLIKHYPQDAHPMDYVRTAVSYLGMEDKDAWVNSREANQQKYLSLLAKLPTAVAAIYRNRHKEKPIAPRENLGFSENFLYMCFGSVPDPVIVKAFDVSMILYAEHGFNASTFTARVVVSTLSEIYSGVTAAIGALKGPLHGGANEQVMHTMIEVGEPAKAKDWMLQALQEKRKIMGFGHRVYKKGDSRVPTMKKYMMNMAGITKGEKWAQMYEIMEKTMVDEKGIYPNLDFPTGPAYYMMGFDIDMFTPLFVMSRITGWSAHVMEQLDANRLIRPLCHYSGVEQRSVAPIEQRA